MLRVNDLVDFRTPTEPILMNFEWKMKYRGQYVPLGREAQQQLTDFYYTSKSNDNKTNYLMLKDELFVADVTSFC